MLQLFSIAALLFSTPVQLLDTPRGKELRIDQWNRGRIVVRGGHVEHRLNGFKVVE